MPASMNVSTKDRVVVVVHRAQQHCERHQSEYEADAGWQNVNAAGPQGVIAGSMPWRLRPSDRRDALQLPIVRTPDRA